MRYEVLSLLSYSSQFMLPDSFYVEINGTLYGIVDEQWEPFHRLPSHVTLGADDSELVIEPSNEQLLAKAFVPSFVDEEILHPCDVVIWKGGAWCYDFERSAWEPILGDDHGVLGLGTFEHHDVTTCSDETRFRHASREAAIKLASTT